MWHCGGGHKLQAPLGPQFLHTALVKLSIVSPGRQTPDAPLIFEKPKRDALN
jgi:hypothetical protein